MTRRLFIKKFLTYFLALIGVTSGTYYYARHIEPSLLRINQETVSLANIPPAFNNFKIVQFSDTHVGFQYQVDQLKELVKTINTFEPNLIVFTGDLLDDPQSYSTSENLINILQQMQASDGKFWVYGNHDHGGYGSEKILNIMSHANFNLLKNDHQIIKRGQDRLIIAGIDDLILGKPNLEQSLQNADPDLFTILLSHEPDFAEVAAASSVDLQLSGHSHGGQVRFPLFGPIYTPIYAKKYISGKYEINNLTLYVNNGIGTTGLPFRFFCKPEIHIYTLKSMKD